jgi:hypothetical protein
MLTLFKRPSDPDGPLRAVSATLECRVGVRSIGREAVDAVERLGHTAVLLTNERLGEFSRLEGPVARWESVCASVR